MILSFYLGIYWYEVSFSFIGWSVHVWYADRYPFQIYEAVKNCKHVKQSSLDLWIVLLYLSYGDTVLTDKRYDVI